MTKCIHFEGLPGSGKTTASERFCKLLEDHGVDAFWWLEESADHPIVPRDRRALSSEQNFPDICLDAWRAFVVPADRVAVLDGYALQSTVRFMFENLVERRQIDEYFARWQQLAPDSSIVYFTVDDPLEHYEIVFQERGEEWTAKLLSYVMQTQFARVNGLNGKAGFVEFWSLYRDLCVELLAATQLPVTFIKSRSWNTDDLKALAVKQCLIS